LRGPRPLEDARLIEGSASKRGCFKSYEIGVDDLIRAADAKE